MKYKFRAELPDDIDALRDLIKGDDRIELEKASRIGDAHPFPIHEGVITTDISLYEIRDIMNRLQDGHVMAESLMPIDYYTGKRLFQDEQDIFIEEIGTEPDKKQNSFAQGSPFDKVGKIMNFALNYREYKRDATYVSIRFDKSIDAVVQDLIECFRTESTYVRGSILKAFALMMEFDDYKDDTFIEFLNSIEYMSSFEKDIVDKLKSKI